MTRHVLIVRPLGSWVLSSPQATSSRCQVNPRALLRLAPLRSASKREASLKSAPERSAAEKTALGAKLADWEARTTNQLAVLIVPTTQPEPIEAYSLRVAEKCDGGWVVHQWVKKAVLLSFRLSDMSVIPGGPGQALARRWRRT